MTPHVPDSCGHGHESGVTPHFGHGVRKLSPLGRLFRFFGWWLGFAGLYSAFTVCPFCGQQGCPVGLVSAGTVGAFLALCAQDWKVFIDYLKRRLRGDAPGRSDRGDGRQCSWNRCE